MVDGPTLHDAPAPPITGADLYGRSGKPHGSDITQGSLGDCYLLSTLGQFADRQPGVITGAIHYDAKNQSFGVNLHDAAGRTRIITVDQDDLRADRTAGFDHSGGVDSPAYWSGTHADRSRPPAWPSVMEVAYAKLHAVWPGDTTATDLNNIGGGGWPKDAIQALTGVLEAREVSPAQLRDPAKAYDLLETSIREGRPVLLATNPMKDKPSDHLVKGDYYGENNPKNSGHAYTVEAVERARDGHVVLTLRNPWGHNSFPQQGVDSASPIVKVSLPTILDNGHLENVTIGPSLIQTQAASRTHHQGNATKRNAPPGSAGLETASRPATDQAATSDPARTYWSPGPPPGPPRAADPGRPPPPPPPPPATATGQGQGRTL